MTVATTGERAQVIVSGELDLLTAEMFRERLAEVQAERPEVVEVDVRRLDFLDSSGLAVLFAANRRACEEGWRLVLLKGAGPRDRGLALARAGAGIGGVGGRVARGCQQARRGRYGPAGGG